MCFGFFFTTTSRFTLNLGPKSFGTPDFCHIFVSWSYWHVMWLYQKQTEAALTGVSDDEEFKKVVVVLRCHPSGLVMMIPLSQILVLLGVFVLMLRFVHRSKALEFLGSATFPIKQLQSFELVSFGLNHFLPFLLAKPEHFLTATSSWFILTSWQQLVWLHTSSSLTQWHSCGGLPAPGGSDSCDDPLVLYFLTSPLCQRSLGRYVLPPLVG